MWWSVYETTFLRWKVSRFGMCENWELKLNFTRIVVVVISFQNQVTDKTPYTIMFGPDKCGAEHKYHFIIRVRNPKTGRFSEHQAKKSSEALESYFTDKRTHLYTLGR